MCVCLCALKPSSSVSHAFVFVLAIYHFIITGVLFFYADESDDCVRVFVCVYVCKFILCMNILLHFRVSSFSLGRM